MFKKASRVSASIRKNKTRVKVQSTNIPYTRGMKIDGKKFELTKEQPYLSGASNRGLGKQRRASNKKGLQMVVVQIAPGTFWKSHKLRQPDGKVFTRDFINGVTI